VLKYAPAVVLAHRYFPYGLLLVDTVLILAGIGLSQETPWDFFLLFFFCLFIAGIGENIIQVVIGCLLLSIIFIVFSLSKQTGDSNLDPGLLQRIPFIFGVSVLYGYLAEQMKREKARAEKAERIENLKRQLVSALAHDIKNPLGVIMGYAENVASRLTGQPNNDENLSALQRIQDNAERIAKLVMGFLDASKIEGGRTVAEQSPVQLNLLIREVAQQQIGDLRKKSLTLKMDLDENLPKIMGDAAQLDRVLWNLVGNAVKFTPAGGNITITSRTANDGVCVSVSDTGKGIPKEELPVLFAEFRRLKGTAKIEGTGLGLFIVKTIVGAHGGTVAVESQEGLGSTFMVRFPTSA
jgi:signal transduction histidine kinase